MRLGRPRLRGPTTWLCHGALKQCPLRAVVALRRCGFDRIGPGHGQVEAVAAQDFGNGDDLQPVVLPIWQVVLIFALEVFNSQFPAGHFETATGSEYC